FNFDLPPDPEVYIHRIGRTARAGKSGCAISLITPQERYMLRRIEKYGKTTINQAELPTEEEIMHKRERSLVEKVEVWLKRGRCNKEKELIGELLSQEYELLDIAAAALKLAQVNEKRQPIEPIHPIEEKKRGERLRAKNAPRRRKVHGKEPGMVALRLNVGKKHGIEVRHIVGSLSFHADIQGSNVGKIRIDEQTSSVDVPEKLVPKVLAMRDFRIGRKKVTVEKE
ncbi:MAG: RNA helicase, partial [Desulfobulbus propionicus]